MTTSDDASICGLCAPEIRDQKRSKRLDDLKWLSSSSFAPGSIVSRAVQGWDESVLGVSQPSIMSIVDSNGFPPFVFSHSGLYCLLLLFVIFLL